MFSDDFIEACYQTNRYTQTHLQHNLNIDKVRFCVVEWIFNEILVSVYCEIINNLKSITEFS